MYYSSAQLQMGFFGLVDIIDDVSASVGQDFFNVPVAVDPTQPNLKIFTGYDDDHLMNWFFDTDLNPDGSLDKRNIYVDNSRDNFLTINQTTVFPWYAEQGTVPYTVTMKHNSSKNIVKISMYNTGLSWRPGYIGVCDVNGVIKDFWYIQAEDAYRNPCLVNIVQFEPANRGSIVFDLQDFLGGVAYLFFYNMDLTNMFNMQVAADVNPVTGTYDLQGNEAYPDAGNGNNTVNPTPIPDPNNINPNVPSHIQYPKLFYLENNNVQGSYINSNTDAYFTINGGRIPCPDLTTVDKKYFLKITWADNTVSVNNPQTSITSFTKKKSMSVTDLPTFISNVRKLVFGSNYNNVLAISKSKNVSIDSPNFEKQAFTYPVSYINYLNPSYYINLPLVDTALTTVPTRYFAFLGSSQENYFDPQNQAALTPEQGLYGTGEFISANRILVDAWNSAQLGRDINGIVTDPTSPWFGSLQGYVDAVNSHTNNKTPVIYKPTDGTNIILPTSLFKVTPSTAQFTNINMLANDTFYIDIFDVIANPVKKGTQYIEAIVPPSSSNLQGISYYNNPANNNTPFVWVVSQETNSVYKYNTNDFSLMTTITNPGSGTFQPFNEPQGIGSDEFQTYVTNTGNDTYAVINNSSGSVTSYWPIGNAPNGMIIYSGSLWVINQWVYTVSRINPTTNAVEAVIPVGDNVLKICEGGGYIWTVNNGGNTISKIDPVSNLELSGEIPSGNLPVGICSGGVDVVTGGTYIWVTNSASNNLTRVDSSNDNTILINGPFNYPNSCVSDGTYVWVTNNTAKGQIVEYNIATGASIVYSNIDTVTGVIGTNPQGITWDGTYLWVANSGFNIGGTSLGTISKILPDHVNGVVTVIQGFGNGPLAITHDSTHIWVTCANDNTVQRYTISSGAIITDSVGAYPVGICTDGTSVFVGTNGVNSYNKINIVSNTVTTIPFKAKTPTSVSSDGINAWITNSTDDSVTQIYVQTNSLIQTLQLTAGSAPNAVYNDGKNTWVCNTGLNTITQIAAPLTAFAPGVIVKTITLPHTTPTAIYSDTTNVYITMTNGSTTANGYLSIYNISSELITNTIQIGANPISMFVDTSYAWILNAHTYTISQVSLQDLSIITSNVGGDSTSNVVGIVSDGIHVWVTDSNKNKVYVSATNHISDPTNNYPYYADNTLFAYPGTNIGTTQFNTNHVVATVKIVLPPTGNNYDSNPYNAEGWIELINSAYSFSNSLGVTTTITYTDPTKQYLLANNGVTHVTNLSTFLSLDWTYYPYYQPALLNGTQNAYDGNTTSSFIHEIAMVNQNKSNRYFFRYAGKWEALNLLGKTPGGMFMAPYGYSAPQTVPQSVPPAVDPNNTSISLNPPYIMNHPPMFNMDGTLDNINDPYYPANSINMMNYPAITAVSPMYPNVINGLLQEIYPFQADPLYPWNNALGASANPNQGLMLNMTDVCSFGIAPVDWTDPILNINYSTISGDHNGIWKGFPDGFQNDNYFNFSVEQEVSEKWYYRNWDVQDSHPFHFHLTSGFIDPNDPYNNTELVSADNTKSGVYYPYSRDTISIGSQTQIAWYLKFSNFNSTSVGPAVFPPINSNLGYMYHCHFMTHHDMMMMGQYFVTPQKSFGIYFPENDPN